jgi:ferredoxin
LCRKCVTVCPKHAILAVNFPTPSPSRTPSPSSETCERKEAKA